VHSIPLSPGEEVNVTHREWSHTSEEFEKIVSDYQESFSEVGVTEKSELAEATTHQEQHSSGYNTGVTVSGGYGPFVNVSSTFSYNVQDSASSSAEASRRISKETTSKASSRTKLEHKVSFRVASAAGTEDETVQKIKNPDLQNPMRVDYYQLMRRWRVDLERYGIRLTYDITIPEPGSDILSRHLEMRALEKRVADDFVFPLSPSQITRANYVAYAAEYQAAVDDPPAPTVSLIEHREKAWNDFDAAHHLTFDSLELDVDSRYRVTGLTLKSFLAVFKEDGDIQGSPFLKWDVPTVSGPPPWSIDVTSGDVIGVSGKIPIVYSYADLTAYYVWIKVTASLKDEVYKAWQLKVWSALRGAAETAFEACRQRCRDRLDELRASLENVDALTLRKMEREEVMKGVIRWLFGPTFRFVPQGLPTNTSGIVLYGSDQQVASDAVWQKMLAYGEIIKFLHNAVEWENVLYFLYPYFWTHPKEWEDRKYISHPDATHQQFLKAGSARVVLTVRPGFERDFLSLVETGDFDALPANHPYVTIADEIRHFAETSYPGIPSANPATHGAAWRQIRQFSDALEAFYGDCGRYPRTGEGLAALLQEPAGCAGWNGPYVAKVPTDPWGNAYVYESPGEHGGFDLSSLGADGAPGGEDADADVVSWAEGRLLATWTEYTPTSALDVAVGDELPVA
jgi:type II secretion system protein G